jgi:putative nucleotidyltransferase with HDIG domain
MGSLKRAVVAIGYTLTQRFVAVAALTLKLGRAQGEVEFDFPAYWTHALRTAHAASLVARAARQGHPDELFAAGLLHDVGKLVVCRHLPEPHRALQAAVKGGEAYAAAERRLLGTEHAEIGACLCERWRFPAAIVAAARHHAAPAELLEETQLPREAHVVAAACRLARDQADVERWTPFLRLPPARVAEIRTEAARRAEACLKDFA